MTSNIVTGSGVVNDVLKSAGDASSDLLRAAELSGWLRPSQIGAGGDSFLPTLAREDAQRANATSYANAANAARSNEISAYSAQEQARLQGLGLLAGLRGPSDAIRYNYMLNRIGAPVGTPTVLPGGTQMPAAGNPLAGFTPNATPGALAGAAAANKPPTLLPNMGLPTTPKLTPPAAGAPAPAAGTPSRPGLPDYLSPTGNPQSPEAQARFEQGQRDGSINIQTQEEDVQQHQADLAAAADQFQQDNGRAPDPWEIVAQEYENRGYDIPGFAMGTMGGPTRGPVNDRLSLVGERGPELLMNHGDGSFDIVNNHMTNRLLDSGLIDSVEMSQYGSGTKSKRQVRFLLSKGSPLSGGQKDKLKGELHSGAVKVKGYDKGTLRDDEGAEGGADDEAGEGEGNAAFVPDAVLDPSQVEDRRSRMSDAERRRRRDMRVGSDPYGNEAIYGHAARVWDIADNYVPGYAAGTYNEGVTAFNDPQQALIPREVDTNASALTNPLRSLVDPSLQQGLASRNTGTVQSVAGNTPSGDAGGAVRPLTPASDPSQALGSTTYSPDQIAGLPAIQKLLGNMPSKSAWGTGLDTRIPGTNTALPQMLNLARFGQQAPSEQALIQGVYETPAELGGLGLSWDDIVGMSARVAPVGTGLQRQVAYGR